MQEKEIRKCNEGEIDLTAQFYRQIVENMIQSGTNYPKWRKNYPDRDSVRDAFCEGSQYICMESDRIVGAMVLNRNPAGAYENGNWEKPLRRGEYLVLHTLATDIRHRARGIASSMIRYAIEQAKQEGYLAVRTDVVPDNAPAKQLFSKMGFSVAGTVDLERGLADIPLFTLFEYNLA